MRLKLIPLILNGSVIEVESVLCNDSNLAFETCEDNMTPLHYASKLGYLNIVNLLITCGADINAEDNFGDTPLHLAAANGRLPILISLVSNGSIINTHNQFGRTPIHLVAEWGHIEELNYLLSMHADVNIKDENGSTPLHWAILNGHEEVAEHLIQYSNNTSLNCQDMLGRTPLHKCIENNQTKISKFLLENHEIDLEITDNTGNTPLLGAADCRCEDAVSLLLAHRADINAQKLSNGDTALHVAVQTWQWEIFNLLLNSAATDITAVNIQNKDGESALHIAAASNDLLTLSFKLLRKGADLYLQSKAGSTPLDLFPGHDTELIKTFHRIYIWTRRKPFLFLIFGCSFVSLLPLDTVNIPATSMSRVFGWIDYYREISLFL